MYILSFTFQMIHRFGLLIGLWHALWVDLFENQTVRNIIFFHSQSTTRSYKRKILTIAPPFLNILSFNLYYFPAVAPDIFTKF